MTDLVVFVEEPSAAVVVRILAERIGPERYVKVVEHEGKSDLVASFPRKIMAWRHPDDVPFVVLHDNDGGNCRNLKQQLVSLVPASRQTRTTVRIAVQCLEAWYLGDFPALAAAGLVDENRAKKLARTAKFRKPDILVNAKAEFMSLHETVGQIALARMLAPHLSLEDNRSDSFKAFVATLSRLIGRRD